MTDASRERLSIETRQSEVDRSERQIAEAARRYQQIRIEEENHRLDRFRRGPVLALPPSSFANPQDARDISDQVARSAVNNLEAEVRMMQDDFPEVEDAGGSASLNHPFKVTYDGATVTIVDGTITNDQGESESFGGDFALASVPASVWVKRVYPTRNDSGDVVGGSWSGPSVGSAELTDATQRVWVLATIDAAGAVDQRIFEDQFVIDLVDC